MRPISVNNEAWVYCLETKKIVSMRFEVFPIQVTLLAVPIFFKVERTRSGRTFATRHVQATQRGKVCFVMYASFQVSLLHGQFLSLRPFQLFLMDTSLMEFQ